MQLQKLRTAFKAAVIGVAAVGSLLAGSSALFANSAATNTDAGKVDSVSYVVKVGPDGRCYAPRTVRVGKNLIPRTYWDVQVPCPPGGR